MYVNERDEINFHGFLNGARRMQKATLKGVGTGICSESEMQYVVSGKRQPEKLVRDRITARLGISSDEYEDYLQPDEYKRWLLRQNLLSAIEKSDVLSAEKLLNEYCLVQKSSQVEAQFIETMRYLIAESQGIKVDKLRKILKTAVDYTVFDIDAALDGAHLLADQELNLIIEYTAIRECPKECQESEWRLEKYAKIESVIQNSHMDIIGKSKVYPRLACYASNLVLNSNMKSAKEHLETALKYCEDAIEYLRRASRLYYFIEVVEYHHQLITCIKPKDYKELIDRDKAWISLFADLYEEYGVNPRMKDFGYLYWESECYDLTQVLKSRRHMKGYSQTKLADGICSVKTIVRYERHKFLPEMVNVRDLFERLSLCAEYKRARIISSDPEALRLSNELADDVNNYEVDAGLEKIEKLKAMLDMSIGFNRQEILMMETMLLQLGGLIDDETVKHRTITALECTLSIEDLRRRPKRRNTKREKEYLTRSELTCMSYLAFWTDTKEGAFCYKILKEICKNALDKELQHGSLCVYEMLMPGVAARLGRERCHKESISCNRKIIKESMQKRRMFNLANNIYCIVWNEMTENKESNLLIDKIKYRQYIQKAALLSGNSRHFALKCLFYRCFGVFIFLRDVNMMLPEKSVYFHYPKSRTVECC